MALDEHAQWAVDARLDALERREDGLVDPVAHEVARRVGAQVGQRVGDPACLGDEGHRQVEREGGAEALRLVAVVEAVLERLDEVRVAVGGQGEGGVGRLPPRGHDDVPVLRARRLEREHGQPDERVVAPALLLLPRPREDEVGDEAVVVGQLARVLDDHPDPPREGEVVDDEGDPHACAGGSAAGGASPPPERGRPSRPSSSWM